MDIKRDQPPTNDMALITAIQEQYNLGISEEEKQAFQAWLITEESNIEHPHRIKTPLEALGYLPTTANSTNKNIEIYFESKNAIEDLNAVLDQWRIKNPLFEIALHKYPGNVFSIEIGNKMGGTAPHENSLYIGHYHPNIKYQNSELLPEVFIKGIMPSSGDIKGFLKHPEALREGTRIVSQHGYTTITLIKPQDEPVFNQDIEAKLFAFKTNYLGLFNGVNNLGVSSNKEMVNLFEQFGLQVNFFLD